MIIVRADFSVRIRCAELSYSMLFERGSIQSRTRRGVAALSQRGQHTLLLDETMFENVCKMSSVSGSARWRGQLIIHQFASEVPANDLSSDLDES